MADSNQEIKATLDEFIVYSKEQTKILHEVLKEIKDNDSISSNRGQNIEEERERNRLLKEQSLLLKKISTQLENRTTLSRLENRTTLSRSDSLPEEGGSGLINYLKLAGLGSAAIIALDKLLTLKPGDITNGINSIGESIEKLGDIVKFIDNLISGRVNQLSQQHQQTSQKEFDPYNTPGLFGAGSAIGVARTFAKPILQQDIDAAAGRAQRAQAELNRANERLSQAQQPRINQESRVVEAQKQVEEAKKGVRIGTSTPEDWRAAKLNYKFESDLYKKLYSLETPSETAALKQILTAKNSLARFQGEAARTPSSLLYRSTHSSIIDPPLRWTGRALNLAGAGIAAYDEFGTQIDKGRDIETAAKISAGAGTGAFIGAAGGAALGAYIGLLFGPGAVVMSPLLGFAGGVLGSSLGEEIGAGVVEVGVDENLKTPEMLKERTKQSGQNLIDFGTSTGDLIKQGGDAIMDWIIPPASASSFIPTPVDKQQATLERMSDVVANTNEEILKNQQEANRIAIEKLDNTIQDAKNSTAPQITLENGIGLGIAAALEEGPTSKPTFDQELPKPDNKTIDQQIGAIEKRISILKQIPSNGLGQYKPNDRVVAQKRLDELNAELIKLQEQKQNSTNLSSINFISPIEGLTSAPQITLENIGTSIDKQQYTLEQLDNITNPSFDDSATIKTEDTTVTAAVDQELPKPDNKTIDQQIGAIEKRISILKQIPSNGLGQYKPNDRVVAQKRLDELNAELIKLQEQKQNSTNLSSINFISPIEGLTSAPQYTLEQLDNITNPSFDDSATIKTEDTTVTVALDQQTKEIKETNSILDRLSKLFEDFVTAFSSTVQLGGNGFDRNISSSSLGSGYTSGIAVAQTTAETEQMMKDVYRAYRDAGFSDKQAIAIVAEVGREGSFLKKNIYRTHIDPKNKAVNLGMFSWQGPRGQALYKELESKGLIQNGKMVENYDTLLTQAQFAKKEMETSEAEKGGSAFLANENISQQEAALLLGKGIIRWRYDDQIYASGHWNRNFYYKRMQELNSGQTNTETSSSYTIDQYRQELNGKRISSEFGPRERPTSGFHKGIDITGESGSPIKMPSVLSSGKVIFAGKQTGYGNLVIVEHPDGSKTKYAHLNEINVKLGDQVNSSSVLGTMGSTGVSTGIHLHFEFVDSTGKRIDPNKAFQTSSVSPVPGVPLPSKNDPNTSEEYQKQVADGKTQQEEKSSSIIPEVLKQILNVTGKKIPLTPKEAMTQVGITPSQADKWLRVNNATDELLRAQTIKSNQPMSVNVNNISALSSGQSESRTTSVEYPTRNMDPRYLTYLNSVIGV